MTELEIYASKLYEIALEQDNLGIKCHALHFLRVHAFETVDWEKYKIYSDLQNECLDYGLGLITIFSKMLTIMFKARREQKGWQTDFQELIKGQHKPGDDLTTKYLSAHYLGQGIDRINAHEQEYLYLKSKLNYVPSIPNIQDPNLNVLAYLLSTESDAHQVEANTLQGQLVAHAKNQHNEMVQMKLDVINATFNSNLQELARIEIFKSLIRNSITKGTKGIFYEYRRTLIELNSLRSHLDFIEQSFVDDLVYKLKLILPLVRQLTQREMVIVDKLKTNQTHKELADALDISEKTLKNHLTSIYKKINVKSKEEALELLKFQA